MIIFFITIYYFSALSILTFFAYPFFLYVISFFYKPKNIKDKINTNIKKVSFIIAIHNAGNLLENKLKNINSLDLDNIDYEIIIFSDGTDDYSNKIIEKFGAANIKYFSHKEQRGKNLCLNDAVSKAEGDILIFSDPDATFAQDTVLNLLKNFRNKNVGGVCGHTVLQNNERGIKFAQKYYFNFDIMIKKYETKLGSITSNIGKICALRKEMYTEIPEGVTDDLYISLSTIKKNRRFIFDKNSIAYIKPLSKSPSHELERRVRIVTGSLRGIFLNKELLNPLKYGFFSIELFINKILRRLMPFFLLLLFISNIFIAKINYFTLMTMAGQIAFYLIAILYLPFFKKIHFFSNIASVIFYFCLGNYGMLIGIIKFLRRETVTKWNPVKDG